MQPPTPVQPPAPAPAPQRNSLALVGFILAIVVFPVGLIISLIALFQTFRRNQKGKVLAALGTVISLAELTAVIVVLIWVVGTVSENVTTVLGPGCTQGKEVILASEETIDSADNEAFIALMQSTADGLDQAAANAKDDEVRTALLALSADYQELVDALEDQTLPAADIEDRMAEHANTFDNLCTIGGAQE
jgi:hypothetical protein